MYDIEDAEIALQAAYDSLNTAQENNNRSAAQTGVELQSIAEEIRLQQEKIKSLAGDESNTVLADVPGTVSTVDCTAGDTVLKNALMATLEVPDMGYTLSFSVTNDQAQRLRIGDTATVSNYYWGNSVTATLTTIRTDPKNPQGGKVLVFDLTGDVTRRKRQLRAGRGGQELAARQPLYRPARQRRGQGQRRQQLRRGRGPLQRRLCHHHELRAHQERRHGPPRGQRLICARGSKNCCCR